MSHATDRRTDRHRPSFYYRGRNKIKTNTTVIYLKLIYHGVCDVVNEQFFDPGLVLYIYESPPGYGILGLRVVAWIYFSYACFFTVKHYPEKSKFYYPFYIFYTIWYVQCRCQLSWYRHIKPHVTHSRSMVTFQVTWLSLGGFLSKSGDFWCGISIWLVAVPDAQQINSIYASHNSLAILSKFYTYNNFVILSCCNGCRCFLWPYSHFSV